MRWLFFLILYFLTTLSSPSANGQASYSDTLTLSATQATLPTERFFYLDIPLIYEFFSQKAQEEVSLLRLAFEGQIQEMEVWRSDIRSPDYQLAMGSEKKTLVEKRSAPIFLSGNLKNKPNEDVALTLHEHFLLGQIGDIFLESAALSLPGSPPNAVVSYKISALPPIAGRLCKARLPKPRSPFHKDFSRGKDALNSECYTAEIALAADYLMLEEFEDLYTLENYLLGILNMVRLTYDDEFADVVRFAVKGIYLSDCASCDPWSTSADSDVLLDSFRDWGNEGGFGFSYDLASLWTGRVLQDSLAGLGYIGALCESSRYNILRKYTDKTAFLRTLQAHEIGHNFDARHDDDGAPFIMAPVIAGDSAWSESSRKRVADYIKLLNIHKAWCLGDCAAPQAAFSAPQLIGCAPVQVQFADSSRGEVTRWQWSFPGGTPAIDTTPNPRVTYTEEGVFSAHLLVGNASGESEYIADSVAIVFSKPRAEFTYSFNPGERSVQFTHQTIGAQAFVWQFGDGRESNVPNPRHDYNQSGHYNVRLIVENDCGVDTTTQLLSLLPAAPTASFSADVAQGCAPHSVQFTDFSSGEIDAWQWTFEGGRPATSTERSPQVIYDVPGSYKVQLKVSNALGADSLSQASYIRILPAPEAAFQIIALANGTDFVFINNSLEADVFIWDFGDGNQSSEISPNHSYPSEGQYLAQLIAINDCGRDTTQAIVNLLSAPQAIIGVENARGCAPLEVRFTDLSPGDVQHRQWRFPGGEPAESNEVAVSVRYDSPGVYDARLVVSNTAGADTLWQTAVVETLENAKAAFTTTFQAGDTLLSFENKSENAFRYEWRFGDGGQSTAVNPEHFFAQDGDYEIMLISEGECGRDTATQNIMIRRPPAANFIIGRQIGCSPMVVQFEDLSSGEPIEREWFFPGGEPAVSTLADPVVVYKEPGIYDVRLKVRNAAGTDSLEKKNLVVVPEKPTAGFEIDYILGDSVVRFQNLSERATNYIWDFGDNTTSITAEPTHIYRQDGDYTVSLQAQNGCQSNLRVRQLTIATIPKAGFKAVQREGCAPLEVQFENASSENAQTLRWQFPGGRPAFSYEENPTVSYTTPGLYDVLLKAGNIVGEVVEEKSKWIKVGAKPKAVFNFQQEGGQIQFINQSIEAKAYLWDFDDGQISEEREPRHEFLHTGAYRVKLIAINECGRDTVQQVLSVIINDTESAAWLKEIKVFPNPNNGRFTIKFNMPPSSQTQLRLWNSLGQLIRKENWNTSFKPSKTVQLQTNPGIYLLEIATATKKIYRRIVVVP